MALRTIYTGDKAICEFLGVSRSTLYRLRREGLPVIRVHDGLLMLIAEDGLAWIRGKREQGQSAGEIPSGQTRVK